MRYAQFYALAIFFMYRRWPRKGWVSTSGIAVELARKAIPLVETQSSSWSVNLYMIFFFLYHLEMARQYESGQRHWLSAGLFMHLESFSRYVSGLMPLSLQLSVSEKTKAVFSAAFSLPIFWQFFKFSFTGFILCSQRLFEICTLPSLMKFSSDCHSWHHTRSRTPSDP